MSLYSYSTTSSSSFKWSESSNSYCLPSSSSITTVSSQSDNERQISTTDDDNDQWPVSSVKENLVQTHWQIEKNVNMKKPKLNGCILKATMTNEQILVHDSSSIQPTIIPGKHMSMKVVFHF